ncbi:uncharacterized protein LOC110466635 [Mizuhopecten yessoensis]|uniref:Uncharacterized protein n=1 Tax=Mizuhopecten yessoensis TaxID=6573 RepID=A0A210R1X8_MIZYE|nr:uncharacterized protein LOC110466635 [Mizuhopecten yessoensis]OWF54895.1 hypothetical protein KP79_PYT18012 [Mizuhopecten yessoensis]
MSTKITMLPEQCKILMRHEVQKQFESGRGLIEVVMKVLQTHTKSFKSQAKERDEADGNLRQLGGEHEDIREVLLTLASLQKDTSTSLTELSKKLDGPVRTLNRWLNDPSTRESESFIMEQIVKLTDQHSQTMVKISKLHKVHNKKRHILEKVQQQIDSYPFSGLDNISVSELKIKMEHFRVEAQAAGQRYHHALDAELRNRLEFIKDAEELEFLFVKHEEKRLLTLVDCIGKYSSILTTYNNPRDKTLPILTDLTELSMIYSPDDEIKKCLARGCRDLTFPFPQVLKEDFVSKSTSHHAGQDDQKLDLESMVSSVTSKGQLTRTSDTSGNANRRFDEKIDDRSRDIYTHCLDSKASCLPFNHGNSKNSGSEIHLNTPKDMPQDDCSQSDSPQGLPLVPKPYLYEDIPVKTSPRQPKMEGLPQIASPETAVHRIMSRDVKTPVQLLRSDSSLDRNLLPKLPRSIIGTPEMTSSQHIREAMNQSPSKPRHHVDNNLPLMPKPMVNKNNVPTLRSESRNGSSSSHPAFRANSRREANVLPKMPSSGKNMLSSPFNAESNQDNVKPGELPPWVKSQTTFLPRLSRTNECSMKSSNLQPNIMVDTVPTKLPVMFMPGTNTANALRSYSRPESQSTVPAVPNRKGGFSILPSKPKVLMDIGNPQTAMVRSTTENVASDTLRSRHRVGVVRQSGQVDSGIAAGFRGSSSNSDFKSQQGSSSACQGPHGKISIPQGTHRVVNTSNKQQRMARAPHGPRGKADGAPYVRKVSDTLCSNPPKQPPLAQTGTTTSSWTRKENLLNQGSLSCVEGNKKEKCPEQVQISNADRLLSKYDIRNLGLGDNEEEEKEDVCKRADELLALYDIRNICSESSLVEQEV